MANPFDGAKAGEVYLWVPKNEPDEAGRFLPVVEHDHELWVALDHALYAKVENFPYADKLWRGGSFRKVRP